MVKRATAILLTFAIVLKISAGQQTKEERDYKNNYYLQNPQDYERIDTFDHFRDQTNHKHQEFSTRPDRDVTQSNDFLYNNNNRFILGNNEQSQVAGSGDSGTLSTPAVDHRKNFNWSFNRGGSNSLYTGSSESQGPTTYEGVNNNDANTNRVTGRISFGGPKNYPNILNKSAPSSGFNFGFNMNGASNQPENSVDSNWNSLANVEGSSAETNFNNLFRTRDGKLMKLVEINLGDDTGNSIPKESQSSQTNQDSISQKNYDVNGGTTIGNRKNYHLGGNANINIGISKNIDVNGQLNLKNAVNDAAGKVVDVTDGLVQKTGTFANAKSDAIHGSVNSLIGAVGKIKEGVLDTTGAIASAKTNAIRGTVNGVTKKVGSIKTGLLGTAGAVVDAKGKAIRGTVNSVAGKVGIVRDGLLHTAGSVTSAKTKAIRGTVNAVTGKVDGITGGLLNTAGAIANAKTKAIRGAVNGVTGKVDDLNKFLLRKAGLIVDAKTGAILGIVNKRSESNENIKGGSLQASASIDGSKSYDITGSINSGIDNIGKTKSGNLQAAGTIGISKSGAISGSVNNAFEKNGSFKTGLAQTGQPIVGFKSDSMPGSVEASGNLNVGGSGSIEFNKRGSLITALNPLSIGKRIVHGGVVKAGAVAGALGGIKRGALNVTDRMIHPGKYYGIGAIKRRIVNNILDDVQDDLQTKIGNVVGTFSQVGEGVKNHITDLSIIDNHGDKNVLRIVNGLYDTSFYLNDVPVEQAYVIFSDENQPVNFFGETLDTQQRIIEECIPTGQVYIAYKPDCVNVEEDEFSSQDYITAQNDVKNQLNLIVDSLFEKYGDQIISKAVSLTNGRL